MTCYDLCYEIGANDGMGRMDAGFFKRGKTYQIRRFVPADLQLFLDRKEILKSLRIGDEAEAIRRYRVEATKIDDYFEQQRQLMGIGTPSPVAGDVEPSSTARTAEGV